MTIPHIPVFLNGRSLAAAPGATLRQLLAEHDAELHAALAAGRAGAVDARGLPVDPDAPLRAGDIFRVGRSARQADGDDDS